MVCRINEILDRAERNHILSEEEIIYLLKMSGDRLQRLYHRADRVRREYVGDAVHLRGLIEFSNHCRRNCHYCGLRRDTLDLERYRLEPEEIVATARKAGELGYKTLVLQSGEDLHYDRKTLARIIETIKSEVDAAITLCVGERDYEDYRLWREKGAERYLLRHETADPRLYSELHPGKKLSERLECLEWLKELDYQVGSGNLIGLPGQDEASIARDLLLLKDLDLDMVGLGPFIPHPGTPLAEAPSGTVEMTLKCIAITRLFLPRSHIPATTALGTLDPRGREKGLQAGANIIMPNVTEGRVRPLYELYPEKICVNEQPENCRECIGKIIGSLGRAVGRGYGHSLKK